ncbi:hypothetical protein WOSG25_070390 [Weissella oryzae SG25]|uniref:Thioredoxin domain-containing protein n=1 Tax=Weissella oryzae (strain DSM 25784 / JCM 18191 / LMG 30913 / SG25) TaxID=1329250 RepID=A0A069CUI4_WEIOS|nr:thioredoxin family protein [Weissella oryzae]GAK31062.1 hypothetical protein WOSG25_070390 [Weissella oryzae SG25]
MTAKNKIFVAIAGIILGLACAAFFFKVTSYPDTNNGRQVVKAAIKQKDDVVIVFHKTGCSDCELIKRTVKETMQANRNHVKYVVIDLKQVQNRYLIKKFRLVSTPTILELKDGREVSRYAGTNEHLVRAILAER